MILVFDSRASSSSSASTLWSPQDDKSIVAVAVAKLAAVRLCRRSRDCWRDFACWCAGAGGSSVPRGCSFADAAIYWLSVRCDCRRICTGWLALNFVSKDPIDYVLIPAFLFLRRVQSAMCNFMLRFFPFLSSWSWIWYIFFFMRRVMCYECIIISYLDILAILS